MKKLKPLSSLAESLPRSGIREIYALSEKIPDAVHLEIGEPDFGTPAHIIEAACKALRSGATKYTSNAGITSLREAIAERASQRSRESISADRVVVAPGAVAGLYVATRVLLEPGEEILVPDPCWPNYLGMVHLAAGRAVRYPLDPSRGFAPDIDALDRLVTPATKAILINSPGNPTGAVLSRSELEAVARFAEKHGLYVLSDEIYEDIVFDTPFVSALEVCESDRTIVVSGVSKGYAMTGFRLGYLIGPASAWHTFRAVIESMAGCVTTVSQHAAEAAIRGPQDCVHQYAQAYRERLSVVKAELGARILGAPRGAFYAMVDVGRHPGGSTGFAKWLLSTRKVAVAPGITFGPDWDETVRICFALDVQRLRPALRAIAESAGQGMSQERTT